ncbi:phosphatidate phosphatase LPIN isoform X3 [Lycorma delicatula]|uniref:phosphatidate phosphatase LPIN isoform X3 n=1 Tax=Lycorma delicatula TaxID=130591 RepID=UPI003F51A79A
MPGVQHGSGMHSMNYLGKFISNFRYVYNEINAATLTGAIDVVVVEQPDGSFTCSPFHVRFGKIGVLRSREKVVDIEINGEPVDIHMKLGESGEAFFVEEVAPGEEGEEEFIPPHLACSPIPVESSFQDRFLAERERSNEDQWPVFSRDADQTNDNAADGEDEEEKPVIVLAGNMPKTFKAETVESAENKEIVRKLSTVSGEFRPISGSRDSEGLQASQQSLSTSDIIGDDSVPAERVSSSSLSSNKRKRRKRSLMKKKNSNNNNNGTNSQKKSTSSHSDLQLENLDSTTNQPIISKQDAEQTTIFPMEDIDQTCQGNKVDNLCAEQSTSNSDLSRMQSSLVESDLHFFSDTEITPGCSPHEGRQFTPVQSDTEFETKRMSSGGESGECKGTEEAPQQSWRWGELPTSNHEESNKQDDPHRSMLHNMLGFMKKTKHIRHNPENEGIYLSDLNPDELDPEVAALYFPSSYKQGQQRNSNAGGNGSGPDEDAESGNGPSLPHSPHSVDGAVCGPKSLDSDFEEPKHRFFGEVCMSLCGGLDKPDGPAEQLFQEHLVHFEDFIENPGLLENPDLVVRIEGKMYRWHAACPIIISHVVFNKSLPQEVISRLSSQTTPRQEKRKGSRRGYSSWFTWGARATDSGVGGKPQIQTESISSDSCDKSVNPSTTEDSNKSDDRVYSGSTSSDSESETDPGQRHSKASGLTIPIRSQSDKYRKTLRLSSEQIAKLNLREGANEVEFSVTTAYQGTSRCKCFLFRWRYDDKIVVSDIDGTITKSDVLGHILPIMGKDWAQSGVAKLFTKIKNNGYKLLYLSARAIGQSRLTRDYLKSIKQEDLSLPEGPILLNPTSLLTAFHTEVIEKKPEEFKISCLRDIQALFPPSTKPFYAGYGNKINDVWAYQAVGIPIFRIFTINHRGELKHELTQTFQSTYSNMSYIVDQMFPAPPVHATLEDFSQFVYWREPIPELDPELEKQLSVVASTGQAVS